MILIDRSFWNSNADEFGSINADDAKRKLVLLGFDVVVTDMTTLTEGCSADCSFVCDTDEELAAIEALA